MKKKGHKLDNNYVFRPLISIKISDSSRSLHEEDGKPNLKRITKDLLILLKDILILLKDLLILLLKTETR